MGITSSSSSSPQSSTASYSQRQQNNKRSILLVDDEPDIIGIFKIDLEDNGFKVDAFIDPQKALSSFKAGIYDLVLIDLIMPKMNGFELYEQIKKIDNKAKICYITAYEINYEAARQVFPGLEIEYFIQNQLE